MCIFAAMNENILPIHFAPLQGYTDAVYRRAHARIFGGIETYYSPFVRMEKSGGKMPVTLSRTTTRTCTSSPSSLLRMRTSWST
jgi:tRNA-dihydrouridine synthase